MEKTITKAQFGASTALIMRYLQFLTYDLIVFNTVFKLIDFFYINFCSFSVEFLMLTDIKPPPSGEKFSFGSPTLISYQWSCDMFRISLTVQS
jgi:hypothetical protein